MTKIIAFKMIKMALDNATITWRDLEKFSPELEGWRQYTFTGVTILVAIVAYVVQRAVYKTLKRLGFRHINQIIIPSLVSFFKTHSALLIFLT